MEPAAPQAIRQNGDRVLTLLFLVLAKIATLRRLQPQDTEDVCRHHRRIQTLGSPTPVRLSVPGWNTDMLWSEGHALRHSTKCRALTGNEGYT
jgi:hypothetical protein